MIELVFTCDKCGEKVVVEGEQEVVSHLIYSELSPGRVWEFILPEDWFFHQKNLYCNRHYLYSRKIEEVVDYQTAAAETPEGAV